MSLLKQAFESLYVFFVLMLFGYLYEMTTGKDFGIKEEDEEETL